MLSAAQFRQYRPRKIEVVGTLIVLVACVIYFGALHVLDGRAETYFTYLRKTDPTRYLTVLRESQGFDAFLAEYRELEGYDHFRALTPIFLVGRWTTRPDTIRLSPGTAPAECSNPVTLDYGLYLQLETGGVSLPVTYRIDGKTVEMRNRSTGVIPVKLVSYGGNLDHIEFVPPGQTEKVYAYLCGR